MEIKQTKKQTIFPQAALEMKHFIPSVDLIEQHFSKSNIKALNATNAMGSYTAFHVINESKICILWYIFSAFKHLYKSITDP